MLCRKFAFSITNDGGNLLLPRKCYSAKIRLIAYLVNDIVKFLQLIYNFLHHFFLHGKQPAIFIHGVHICTGNAAQTIDIVDSIHWAEQPLTVFIKGTEKSKLHNNPALLGFPNK